MVNLSPTAFELRIVDGSGLYQVPRCLQCDVSLFFAKIMKATDLVALEASSDDLKAFSDVFQLQLGSHGGGHYTMGGHQQVDRL